MSETRPPTAHEQALELLKKGVHAAMRLAPEIDAVTVSVLWRGNLKEVPAGFILVPESTQLTPEQLLAALEQTLRVAGVGMARLQQAQTQQAQTLRQLEQAIRDKEKTLGQLNTEKTE